MKKALVVVVVFVASGISYVAAGPFVTINDIRSAIKQGDSEALSSSVDFPVLRSNLKEQLNALMVKELASEIDDNPFAALGMAVTAKLTDGIVETFVTPYGLAHLMSGERPSRSEKKATSSAPLNGKLFRNVRYSYDSVSKFSAWVKDDVGGEIRFVFSRDGISWKLSNIILPDSLFRNSGT